jgi:prepilin-type N-terminal cleavage/methylation domain-containing protein
MNPGRFCGRERISKGTLAFTLIELLAVISIIALLAALILGLSGLATNKMRKSRMEGEHARLVTAIDSYKAELGNFPPDNGLMKDASGSDTNTYHKYAGMNPLFYELSGATFDSAAGGTFTTQNKADSIKVNELTNAFTVKGIENSARVKKDIPFRGVTFKLSQYADLDGFENVQILISPLKGPYDSAFKKKTAGNPAPINPWFYDASSTNRHNQDGYDLWTEYLGPNGTIVVGNWKD